MKYYEKVYRIYHNTKKFSTNFALSFQAWIIVLRYQQEAFCNLPWISYICETHGNRMGIWTWKRIHRILALHLSHQFTQIFFRLALCSNPQIKRIGEKKHMSNVQSKIVEAGTLVSQTTWNNANPKRSDTSLLLSIVFARIFRASYVTE